MEIIIGLILACSNLAIPTNSSEIIWVKRDKSDCIQRVAKCADKMPNIRSKKDELKCAKEVY